MKEVFGDEFDAKMVGELEDELFMKGSPIVIAVVEREQRKQEGGKEEEEAEPGRREEEKKESRLEHVVRG